MCVLRQFNHSQRKICCGKLFNSILQLWLHFVRQNYFFRLKLRVSCLSYRFKRSTRDFYRPFHLDLSIDAAPPRLVIATAAHGADSLWQSWIGSISNCRGGSYRQWQRPCRKAAAATATTAVARIAHARYRSNLRLSPTIVHGAVCRSLEI